MSIVFLIPIGTIPKTPLYLCIGVISLFFNKVKRVNFIEISLLILSMIFLVAFPSLVLIFNIFCIILISQIKKDFHLKKNIITKFITLWGISVLIMMLFFNYNKKIFIDRFDLGTDANYSGIIVLLLFLVSNKFKNNLTIIISLICIILIQSRNAIIAVGLFYLINTIKNRFKHYSIFVIKPGYLLVFFNLLVLGFSIYYSTNNISDRAKTISSQESRLMNYNDQSNAGRFIANSSYIYDILNNIDLFLTPFPNFEESLSNRKATHISSTILPHNSFLHLIVSEGILLGLMYFIYIITKFNKTSYKKNYEYIVPYIFTSLFLHGLYTMAFFIVFYILIDAQEEQIVLNRQL